MRRAIRWEGSRNRHVMESGRRGTSLSLSLSPVERQAASGKRQAASGKRSARIERVPLCATHRSTHGIAPDDGNRDRVGCMNAVTRAWSFVTAAVTIRE
ncbi:transcriptional regulator, AraC family [Burkholderia pseudomallei MSHR3709]|nr:transcriptional regulator, AraC family [Burkholderia pseudomallei MSHR3709]